MLADTNIIFSFFLNSAKIQRLITDEVNGLQLFVADYAFEELNIHRTKLMKAGNITLPEYKKIRKLLYERVHTLVKTSEIDKKHIRKAIRLIEHIDMDDVLLIVASALSIPCHLWTSDKPILEELRRTNTLKTVTTAELFNKIYKK